jgi:hypothetical protein
VIRLYKMVEGVFLTRSAGALFTMVDVPSVETDGSCVGVQELVTAIIRYVSCYLGYTITPFKPRHIVP